MFKISFSIRTLLLAIAVVAVYFPVTEIYEPWRRQRLQETHQIFSDFETLAKLDEGDSVQDVERHYPMLSVVESGSASWSSLAGIVQSASLTLESTDEFYQYTLNEEGMFGYLQFRNGQLVNHAPEIYADPVANTLRSGAKLPGGFDRLGVWPIYLMAVGLIVLVFSLGSRAILMFRSRGGDRDAETTKLARDG